MFDYTGCECRSCGKKFTSEDDIVVCPECGTPYHRECWKKEGKCINTELHESKKSWQEINREDNSAAKCKKCGNTLKDEQFFCDKCGTPTDFFFSQNQSRSEQSGDPAMDAAEQKMENIYPYMINFSDPLCGFNPEEKFGDSVTVKDMGDFVGSNTHYYLPKFRNMKNLNLKLSLNFPAMFFPDLYFAYRKMPVAAALALIFKTIVGFPAMAESMRTIFMDDAYRTLYSQLFPYIAESIENLVATNIMSGAFLTVSGITNILHFVGVFFFAGFSNYFYYRHALGKASEIKKRAAETGRNVSFELKQSGGTSFALLILFVVLMFVMEIISMGAVLWLVKP
ncbi:MAG: hypothetical protein MSJ26_09650 [Oscillospiraceae bacterium]|nr:hypothetical protein [Oscillospiraceae bacterium]